MQSIAVKLSHHYRQFSGSDWQISSWGVKAVAHQSARGIIFINTSCLQFPAGKPDWTMYCHVV